jgi:nucleoside-diphosphate-sugar epimerase
MTVLLIGSAGFIGSYLTPFLTIGGYKIICLLRSRSLQLENTTQKSVQWDPITGSLSSPLIDGADA